ncbi:beta-lactamase/transpeptidase-like protein [Zopfia rhizophila CBS 207.26]|uniref:Beta-lactamase/transpeptidase-like protein n=1 Tax=Zopfia rhizophila CBS 207.26 TaxID=1314779 RepID=A0A6A6EP96_9PEZI|nr:beta-lactamase/transpeptidase-like protein [Zopfia rhizophila CBS 207.26]
MSRPRFPIPASTATSPIIQEGVQNLTDTLNKYVTTANGKYGTAYPNTTSFSIALFSIESTNSSSPFFYEYHHTAPTLKNSTRGVKKVDSNSVYRIGDLTTLFTTWLFLIGAGEEYWLDPVSKWAPELSASNSTAIAHTQWDKLTLADLAAHLGGIGSYAPTSSFTPDLSSILKGHNKTNRSACATGSPTCTKPEFLQYFGQRAPVMGPGTTPIFSNAGFIILAHALETITGKSFASMLNETILEPLGMSSTTLLQPLTVDHAVLPSNDEELGWDSPVEIEAAFNGLYSSITDISTSLRAILASQLLSPSTTSRWLKPVSHTSNRANPAGRPWEIYSLTATPISPVIPVYQVRGNVGLYSSHIGLVPDYKVGFVILAADSDSNPDLNAYADIIAEMLIPALEQNAIFAAGQAFSGNYSSSNSNLVIAEPIDSSPGLSLSSFMHQGIDIRAAYAEALGIEPENLSVRFYPTDLKKEFGDKEEGGYRQAFRAVFQDITAPADAGTPTCETWRYVDQLQVNGVGLDGFVFEVRNGEAVGVEVPALGLRLER